MTKKSLLNISIVVAILAAILLPKIFSKDIKQDKQKGGKGEKPTFVITAYAVEKSNMEQSFQATGTLLSLKQIEIKNESAGRVIKMGFKEGDKINAGELLIKINDTELQAQLAKLESSLKLKQLTENRNRQMLDKGGISAEQLDIIQNEIASIKADIAYTTEQIRKTEIYAPFSGAVGLTDVTIGTYLAPGTVITSLHQNEQLKVAFVVPSKYVKLIHVNDVINFTVDNDSSIYKAKIYALEPGIDDKTRNISLRAITDNKMNQLSAGLFVKINFGFKTGKESVMVPTQAVVPILKGQKVLKIQGDSVVDQKIKIGIRNDSLVEVTAGLIPGDRIALKGVIQLKQGSKVKVSNR